MASVVAAGYSLQMIEVWVSASCAGLAFHATISVPICMPACAAGPVARRAHFALAAPAHPGPEERAEREKHDREFDQRVREFDELLKLRVEVDKKLAAERKQREAS